MKRALACASLLILMTAPAMASDTGGNFRVKGFGANSCKDFLAAKRGKQPSYLAYRSWLNGYLTAYNQSTQKTFDIAGKSKLQGQLSWIEGLCATNQSMQFVDAATALTAALYPKRVSAKRGGAKPPKANPKTVRAIQAALKKQGYYKGRIDGGFGPSTRKALKAYQRAKGLPPTGYPNVPTLSTLLKK